jgi:protocatechuate 3,4-dioxygenase beta subunit
MLHKLGIFIGVLALTAAAGAVQQPPQQPPAGQGRGGRGGQQQPARDRAAQQQPAGTAVVTGRIVAADTGRPIKRARVTVAGGPGRRARATTTDDQGRYQVTELSPGNYTITASRTGFVDGIYGQRRALQPGTPLEVADGQQLTGIDLRLTRGGVITGRVLDEDGEPLARALVTVQRYQYIRGERQLTPAGGDQSDDRGVYRMFGLPPGEYYVSADAASLFQVLGRGGGALAALAGAGGPGGGRGGRGGFFGGVADDPEPTGYAPTYYPGVVSAGEATKITVAPGQEVSGIDFQVQLVPTATVRGIVAGADGPVPVLLVPTDAGGMLRAQMLRGGAAADGTFTITNVPPGRYTAVARTGGFLAQERMAVLPLTVQGQDVSNVTLVLQPGVRVSGNITVESSGTPAPTDYSAFRVDIPEAEPILAAGRGGGGRGGGPNATGGRAQENGTFSIDNLMPGKHYFRVTGQGAWALKSVTVGGSDVTDEPVDLRSGQNVDNVVVVLTDRATDLSGTIRDGIGAPLGGITVIAFSTDPQYWHSDSRMIQAVHTGQTGAYRIRGLPPGNYNVIAVDDVETGEWFDPAYLQQAQQAAKSITLNEGDKKTLDLSGPSAR